MSSSSGFCSVKGLTGGSMKRIIMQTLFVLTLSNTPSPVRPGQVRNVPNGLLLLPQLLRSSWNIIVDWFLQNQCTHCTWVQYRLQILFVII